MPSGPKARFSTAASFAVATSASDAGRPSGAGGSEIDRPDAPDQPGEAGALADDGDEDHREGGDQHQVAARHRLRQGQRDGQRDDAAHPGPAEHRRLAPAERPGAAQPGPATAPRAISVAAEHPGEAGER